MSTRNEPVFVEGHICMETTQRISLNSYRYLKLAKIPCLFIILCFFFKKIRGQEGGRGSAQRQRAGRGKMAQIMYICK
jgi:hypothetical protein